jgi:hypothetical protein
MKQYNIQNLTFGTVHNCTGNSIGDAVENLIANDFRLNRKVVKAYKQRNRAEAIDFANKNNGVVFLTYSSDGKEIYYAFENGKYVYQLSKFADFMDELSGHVDSVQKIENRYRIRTKLTNEITTFANIDLEKTPIGYVAHLDISNRVGNRVNHKCAATDIDTIQRLLLICDVIKI